MPTLANEFQCQETSTSSQGLFETNNLKSSTYDDGDDDDFRNGSHDDLLSGLGDLIAYSLQEFDFMKTFVLILTKKPHCSLVLGRGLCTSDGL